MSNNGCLIGFPNRVDETTLSGGSYVVGLPLNNLKNRLLGKVARTTNAATTSTTFHMSLPLSKPTKLVSLINHNISLGATWRIRASDEASMTNLIWCSENLVNSSVWLRQGTTVVTANSTNGPDGLLAMDFITCSAGSSDYVYQTRTVVAGANYTFSIYIKQGGSVRNRIVVTNGGVGVNLGGGNIVWNSGIPSVEAGGVGITIGPPIPSNAGTTLYRVSITFNSGIYTDPAVLIYADYNSTGFSLNAGYAQLELGTTATSYYSTGSNLASGTRPLGYMDTWQSYSYDSGVIDVWPAVYETLELDWEEENWWSGMYTQEQISGYTPTAVHLTPDIVLAHSWRIDIQDTLNTAGYVQIGRVFLGPAWIPEYDAEVGLGIGWESATTTQTALSGTDYFQRRTPYRVTNFTLNNLSVDEAMAKAFEIDRMAGIDKEVFWVQQQDDTTHALRRRFLGTLRQMSAVEFPYTHLGRKQYQIKEVV